MRAWLALLMAPVFIASAAAEPIHFRSATWPPTPLQLRLATASGDTIAEQASVSLCGELHRPPGDGPSPAVVLLHPCSGRLPIETRRPTPSVTPRSATRCSPSTASARAASPMAARGGGASVDGVMDAYGALLHLASLPFIDPERIAVVGYSFGASVALSAVEFDGPERLFDRQFVAAVAYYPYCPEKLAVSVPTVILAGALDDWAPVRVCRADDGAAHRPRRADEARRLPGRPPRLQPAAAAAPLSTATTSNTTRPRTPPPGAR